MIATPLKENDYCFVLQTTADHQGSKIPFRDYCCVGPFIVQKVLHIENSILRRPNTNKTQILHRIRLKILFQINRLRIFSKKSDYNRMKKSSFRKTIFI